ncbi:sugar transferase [Plectonema radiosum NIES-515]|uniref:Sugar transferase n=1 Tax=Plectonema radiosum NIES-515 TaxID=2986073 RepID=A0ABT3AXI8_9CYAN|nr:heterocyst development glycosyltransferase HepC [Plectonema radiosum]MCV3213848.1 sugar transferase [Plectonema radiosum NIES-515]
MNEKLLESDYQVISAEGYVSKHSRQIYPSYKIKLRLGQLLVRQGSIAQELHLLSSRNEQFLAEWLQYCPAHLVRIDPVFGECKLKTWAKLCYAVDKKIFLWIPRHRELPEYRHPILWLLKRSLDWIIAFVLLIILSPVLGAIALKSLYLKKPIFAEEWCVGKQGKLFLLYNFQDLQQPDYSSKQLSRKFGMRKYNLKKLPQLFNVLKGDMSLVGRQPIMLHDAIKIGSESKNLLNALPGITGAWQLKEKIDNCDQSYIKYWSLSQDLKILLLTIF